MKKNKKKSESSEEIKEIKRPPVISCVCPTAWWDEVGSVMVGKFSEDFIQYKAKEAFGYLFEEERFTDIKSDIESRVKNVWDSQK